MKIFGQLFKKHFSAIIVLSLLVFIALACDTKSDSEWESELGGKKLTTAKTSGSISDKIEIWFCPSGEYAKRTEFVGVSGDFTMADADVEQGRWTIDSGVLTLTSGDGKTSQYDLSPGTDSDVIRLNGTGYLVERHNRCGR
jgi:hypothetical protein